MAGVAAAIGGSAVLGAVMSSRAAGAQSAAADKATALQGQSLAAQQANEAPYQAAGVNALAKAQDPRFQQDFNQSMFKESPGYQFSLQQGQSALNAANAASGNNVSGAGLAALSNYNVGSANQEYQQAFNNYQTQQNNQFGRLSQIAGMGAGANAQSNAANQNYANQSGANAIGAGNAQAASDLTIGSSLGKGITGIAGNFGAPSAGANNPYTASSQNGATIAGGPMDSGGFSNASSFANPVATAVS